jgi:hypothetical protein
MIANWKSMNEGEEKRVVNETSKSSRSTTAFAYTHKKRRLTIQKRLFMLPWMIYFVILDISLQFEIEIYVFQARKMLIKRLLRMRIWRVGEKKCLGDRMSWMAAATVNLDLDMSTGKWIRNWNEWVELDNLCVAERWIVSGRLKETLENRQT